MIKVGDWRGFEVGEEGGERIESYGAPFEDEKEGEPFPPHAHPTLKEAI